MIFVFSYHPMPAREGGKEGGREGWREGRREGGREGGREGLIKIEIEKH